jgi:hypothetical protein
VSVIFTLIFPSLVLSSVDEVRGLAQAIDEYEEISKCVLPNTAIVGFELRTLIKTKSIINGRSSSPRGIRAIQR